MDKAQRLPPDMQDKVAPMVLSYAGDDEPVIDMTAEEEGFFEKTIAQAERGAFATDEQMRAI